MQSSEKKLLIFDYDGTIADTSELHEIAFQKVLEPFKINFEYSRVAGLKTKDAIHYCLNSNNINLSKNKVLNLVRNKQEIFQETITNIKPILGVSEFLNWVFLKYHLIIASSGSRVNVLKGLKILGFYKFFNKIICAEDVFIAKPDPEIFIKALSSTNFTKNDALIFEDSDNGIIAAKSANIDCFDIRKNSFKDLLNAMKGNAS